MHNNNDSEQGFHHTPPGNPPGCVTQVVLPKQSFWEYSLKRFVDLLVAGAAVSIGSISIFYIVNISNTNNIKNFGTIISTCSANPVGSVSFGSTTINCGDIISTFGGKVDYDRIARVVVDEMERRRLCVKVCKTHPPEPCESCSKDAPPRIEPGSRVEVTRTGSLPCGADDYRFDYYRANAASGAETRQSLRLNDLNLPSFCASGTRVQRVIGTPGVSGAPYVSFLAVEEANPRVMKAYFVFVSGSTGAPDKIEITFESRRGKPLISPQGNAQVVSNLRYDPDNCQITFQIGAGVYELTVAGQDFGPKTNPGEAAGRALQDASGSYVIDLTCKGGVREVRKL